MRILTAFFVVFFGLGNIALAQAPIAGKAEPSSAQLQNGCDNGNATDCGDLGHRYETGKDTPKNAKTAAALFQRACDGGDAYGCMRLAIAYNDGSGVKADDARAAKLAERACNGGSAMGCALLGAVYSKGGGGYPKDVERAQELFGQACFSTNDFEAAANWAAQLACPALTKLTGKAACASLGGLGGDGRTYKYCYENERGWKQTIIPAPAPQFDPTVTANTAITSGNEAYAQKNYAAALAQFAAACDANNASACAAVGNMYIQGEGVTSSGARAAAPLAKACDGGIAAACGKLGALFDTGNGVSVNRAHASQLYAQACKSGYTPSCEGSGSRVNTFGQATAAPSNAVAYFDQLVAEDAASWMMNRYDRGSMRNMKIVSSSDGGRTRVVAGDYTYNGGQSGWVKAQFRDEKLVCLEFWDYSGQCRPLGRSPSQGVAAGLMGALAIAMMSGDGGASKSSCREVGHNPGGADGQLVISTVCD